MKTLEEAIEKTLKGEVLEESKSDNKIFGYVDDNMLRRATMKLKTFMLGSGNMSRQGVVISVGSQEIVLDKQGVDDLKSFLNKVKL